jgi:hypothetical protein
MSNLVVVLAREDVDFHHHTLQTMTEQSQLCEWGNCRLGKLLLTRAEKICINLFPFLS